MKSALTAAWALRPSRTLMRQRHMLWLSSAECDRATCDGRAACMLESHLCDHAPGCSSGGSQRALARRLEK